MQSKNCYIVLGVSRTASSKEIKSAYRLLAKKFHPDKNQGSRVAEENFKEIQDAYAVLSNTEKRRNYDLNYTFSSQTKYKKHYTPYSGNAYQYAQQHAKYEEYYDSEPVTNTPKHYKTELNQIIISIIIALILLYFIVSY